jgi:hypothetical protein
MASNNVLRWLDGQGWLILSGSPDASSEVRAQAIGRAAADGGVAYASLGGDLADKVLSDMESLGSPAGFVVDLLTEDDETIRTKLYEAGIIVIEAGKSVTDIRSALLGAAVEGMRTAFENGALVLAEGAAASVFGEWAVVDGERIVTGLGWFKNAVVLADVTSAAESPSGKLVLAHHPNGIAVGLGKGSALALGPAGEVETWGNRQVTLALGAGFSAT